MNELNCEGGILTRKKMKNFSTLIITYFTLCPTAVLRIFVHHALSEI